MTKPIRATRDNLLPGTIWQNAAGTEISRVSMIGGESMTIDCMGSLFKGIKNTSKSNFLKFDIWYKVQPIKEPTE